MMSLFSTFDVFNFYWNFIFISSLMLLNYTLFINFNKIKIFTEILEKNLIQTNNNLNKVWSLMFVSIFSFMCVNNFMSLLPFFYTETSRLSMVLNLSLIFFLCLLITTSVHKMKMFLSHLVPTGSPMYLVSLLFVIELVSTLIKPITLSIRLVANMLAGHILLSLIFLIVNKIEPLFILFLFMNLVEVFVSFIQSYIFFTLAILYYSENF